MPLARLEAGVSALVRWSESNRIRLAVARQSGCDLASSELRLLEHFDLVAPMRISAVADCLHVDVSTVSIQLRRLRQDRLVEGWQDGSDRRVTLVSITDEGRAVLARVRTARRALLGEVFAQLPAAEMEQAAAVLLLVQQHMLGDAPRTRD
jgi:DNA-binding MarR family transcriptional regulator